MIRVLIDHQSLGGFDQIEQFKPDAVAIENIFVAKNVASTLKLGHARGAAMVAAVNADLPVAEYTPLPLGTRWAAIDAT